MHDAKKRSGSQAAAQSGSDKAGGKLRDAGTDKLRQMSAKLGNDELQQQIQKGNASRDDMMAFLRERLQTIKKVQDREIDLSDTRSTREHWKQISDKNKDVGAPDPTRWRETARIYEEAAYQLSRGSLGRGRQLMERAMAEERKTFDGLTSLVKAEDVELESLSGPSSMEAVNPADACAETSMPADIRDLARDIQRVTEKPEPVPWRRRVRDPWWTFEEEEEEEEGEGG